MVATPGALEALTLGGQTFEFFLEKHLSWVWGDVNVEDHMANDQALIVGSQLQSSYRTLKRVEI